VRLTRNRWHIPAVPVRWCAVQISDSNSTGFSRCSAGGGGGTSRIKVRQWSRGGTIVTVVWCARRSACWIVEALCVQPAAGGTCAQSGALGRMVVVLYVLMMFREPPIYTRDWSGREAVRAGGDSLISLSRGAKNRGAVRGVRLRERWA